MVTFDTKVENLTSVGKTTGGRLKKINITTAADLLWNIPRTHEDLSEVMAIKDIKPGYKICLQGKIEMIETKRSPRRRMYITEAWVADSTGQLKVIWFNQPYLTKTLQTGDAIFLAGEIQEKNLFEPQLTNPTWEKITTDTIHTARIVPLYHLTAGLTQKQLRFLIKQVLPLADRVADYLPAWIKTAEKLPDLSWALRNIHFPDKIGDFQQSLRRLKFDELFFLLWRVIVGKNKLAQAQAPAIKFQEELIKRFVSELPFQLTNSQRQAAWEILQDLQNSRPMNRLLEGDVGSGKTVVAGLAILNTISQGRQAVLLAPTEILARQHFATFVDLFAREKIPITLFTRTDKKTNLDKEKKTKAELLAAIVNNELPFIIGTHALLQEAVEFSDLALIVIDEQHRFGVAQRQQLKDKTPDLLPHFLSMTATPIPRSLALTLYGDLDISLIKEKPQNRKPVITKLITQPERPAAYDFVQEEIKQGHQAFVICPLIDESDKLGVKSAEREYKNLSEKIFPNLKIGLVHGKLKKSAKEQVMADFRNNKLDLLVATAVVEVGVDIPNATIMLIEGAERFGLAQLHQFRGRVGRSDQQSYCLLFTENTSPKTKERLQILTSTDNGFELAEADLAFRGPGEIYGYKQSGLPELSIASWADTELAKKAKYYAEKIVATDPNLKSAPELKNKLNQTLSQIHWE